VNTDGIFHGDHAAVASAVEEEKLPEKLLGIAKAAGGLRIWPDEELEFVPEELAFAKSGAARMLWLVAELIDVSDVPENMIERDVVV
jgi:hypothetical protein